MTERAERAGRADDRAVFVISVAAELAGVHPQTLRIYERKGLVRPRRTAANSRRYSPRDIEQLRQIQDLTGMGINLAGVAHIMALSQEVERLTDRVAELEAAVRSQARRHRQELDAARRAARREIVPLDGYPSAIVVYEPPGEER